MKARMVVVAALCGLLMAGHAKAVPVGTSFTYQGRLIDGSLPANGAFDLRFTLYDASLGGSQVGSIVTSDDVPVSEGLFVVALDFGATPFAGGEARWLETAVRPGASTGAYTTLSRRQALTPTLQATYSAATPWSGVSGKPAGFADDVDNDSGGTVTQIATGAGLTGGPISSAGTVAIATGGVVSSMVANGAIGLVQINPAQVQARATGICPVGSYLRGINADGSALCTGLPNPHTITVADDPASSVVGSWSSVAIGIDGLPVISYYESTGGSLKVLKCGNLACSAGNVLPAVDNLSNDVGAYTSIAMRTSGLPLISYYDATVAGLKVASCVEPACNGFTILTTVDAPAANNVGQYTSIAIGADGFGVVSYYDATAGALKVLKCGNATCNASNTVTTVDDTANNVGEFTSIAVPADGLPVISYYDHTALALKVTKCGNAACTAGNVTTFVDDPANNVGDGTSIAIGADGLPVISYHDLTAVRQKVAKCGNAACNAGNTITTLATAPSGVLFTSMAIGTDGLPVIAYRGGFALWVTHCGNVACTAGNVSAALDAPLNATAGQHPSIAIGSDGLPIISHHDSTNGALRIVKCGNAACQ